ncbi:hypothetical protein DSAG12_00410 [Promethearchaeum syntrophicum]|uniref:Uncharacterized protein n=1 Tax=Promethearchaeum syntrophicum TaxID=2594042 RepID=A0A5B9D715_9ARCH|nr:hypothetical protein [Candidatus Prometheoarchaeum syntrophicum]QEE14597.1 hypothetical protein DSAG12_00410 [Candidatus Prometheoarchaeum syntrophicum]
MSDISEKLHELQESMQKLTLLKQLGAEKLILEQENEIFHIQQEIMNINANASVDIIDTILPKKCKFCTDHLERFNEEEKLDCYEKNYSKCKKKEPKNMNLLSMNFLKVILMYLVLLGLLFAFLIITNILFTYFEGQALFVFIGAFLGMMIIIIIFRKPVRKLYKSIS